jgi:transformation/transcription domain-associated protein
MPQRQKAWTVDLVFRQNVAMNIDGVVKRAETMACKTEREQVRCCETGARWLNLIPLLQALQNKDPSVPIVQTVTNLISSATNPLQLAKMGELYQPWF